MTWLGAALQGAIVIYTPVNVNAVKAVPGLPTLAELDVSPTVDEVARL